MPDVAHSRVRTGSGEPAEAQPGAAVAQATQELPGQHPSSREAATPARTWRIDTLLLERLGRSMRALPVRRTVAFLGAAAATATALFVPAALGVLSYWKSAEILSFRAELHAVRAAHYIFENGDWRKDPSILANAMQVEGAARPPVAQRVFDAGGGLVLERGGPLPSPTLSRSAPILIHDNAPVGRVEVVASLRPLLVDMGLAALASLTLAAVAYAVFGIVPLRALDATVGELEAANARFREQNMLLDAALANMFQGLAMFDAAERLVVANRRFAEMYGLAPSQLSPGTPLRRIVELRAAAGHGAGGTVEQQLLAVREHVGRRRASHMAERLSDGRAILVSIRPSPDGGWVATHQDVTDRENLNAELAQQNELLRQREEQLEARNEQFDAALRNMSQGLCMFDAEQRVVIANARFGQMYGLGPESVRPGTTLREIIEARIARGIHAGDPERYLREQLASFNPAITTTTIDRLSDGRHICIVRQPMRGGGWVTTHEDVTERQELLAQLERQRERLDAALNNMAQGLAVFDADRRLVLCNELYGRMYGLAPERLTQGTALSCILAQLVASGLYTEENVDDVLRFLAGCGGSQGAAHFVGVLRDGRSIAVTAQMMAGGRIVTTHRDITEQRQAEARIVHMALHDTLTGLPNRMLLNERLEQALTRVRRGEVVALHMLDLDHFKSVNDMLGHPAGDRLLCMVTARLRALVRETDTIARMGGDEFAIVQVAISGPADATVFAHRIVALLSKPYDIDGHQVVIGASVGIAMGPADGITPDDLIRNSDLALYRAKSDGRGTVCFFEQAMDVEMQATRALEYDLRRALTAGEFELHYQPIVDVARNDISGFEALVRWRHPKNGLMPPLLLPSPGRAARRHARPGRMGDPCGLHHGSRVAATLEGCRQSLARTVPQSRPDPGRGRRDRDLGLGAGSARARGHRAPAADHHRSADRGSRGPARSRRQDRHGGLRLRVLLVQLPAELPFRQDQDRSLLRAHHALGPRRAQPRARHHRHGTRPRHGHRRGGRGNRRGAGRRQVRRLHGDPGLLLQPAGACRGDRAAARGKGGSEEVQEQGEGGMTGVAARDLRGAARAPARGGRCRASAVHREGRYGI